MHPLQHHSSAYICPSHPQKHEEDYPSHTGVGSDLRHCKKGNTSESGMLPRLWAKLRVQEYSEQGWCSQLAAQQLGFRATPPSFRSPASAAAQRWVTAICQAALTQPTALDIVQEGRSKWLSWGDSPRALQALPWRCHSPAASAQLDGEQLVRKCHPTSMPQARPQEHLWRSEGDRKSSQRRQWKFWW